MTWDITIRNAEGQAVSTGSLVSGSLTIGRGPDNALVIADPSISRKHARLDVRDGELWISDLDSANGVMVDGQRIAAACVIDADARVELAHFGLAVVHTAAPELDLHPVAVEPPMAPVVGVEKPVFEDLHAFAASVAPSTPPQSAYQPPPASSAADLLAKKIESIRSHREGSETDRDRRRKEFEDAWNQVLDELRALRSRLNGEERVLYFTVARDGLSVAMKIRRGSGHASILMTRGHPDRPVGGEEKIFIRDHELPDRNFSNPVDAMNQFLSHLASILA